MPELPFGTVTFLFTDIEGSTRLWEEHPEPMRCALARHDELASSIIVQYKGALVKSRGGGDSLFAVFARASDAIAGACALQRAYHGETWPERLPLRVRMALHTGEADLRDGDYYGATVNRCARLRAIGHGGQVLLSAATQELVRDSLPPEATLRECGEHRLRDLGRPETVFQLCHLALPSEFPPLLSLESLLANLPLQLTSFIGRDKELAEVKALVDKTKLLTLTGSAGCGKTRLALQVAADLLDEFPDGVWLVELAPLAEAGLVSHTVAQALGIREESGKSPAETLADHLKARRLLLVMDNCEHLLDDCAKLADATLRNCPRVRILATSREALGIAGELTCRVPSLSLPDPKRDTTPESLSHYEAVRLFMDRARSHQPHFAITSENAPAVASICHRLDGIPLAIELAAARIQAMSVEQVEHRLDQRFRLLTGGSRTALPRQQTLRSLIDWSYDLLTDAEKALLCRISVFMGGWTLEAAEGVCAGDGVEEWEVLDLLASLVAKSLVVYDESAAAVSASIDGRYRLLETIRQYARDRLMETGAGEAVRGRHLDWFMALAERAQPELFGPEQRVWLDRLEREHDNLRAALTWVAAQEHGATGLRLGAALWRFWSVRGFLTEGSERLREILSHPRASAPTVERAGALDGAGLLAMNCGDFTAASALFEEALSIGRELEDGQVIAMACNSLGDARRWLNDIPAARPLYEEALRCGREVNDRWNIAYALTALGILAAGQGDEAEAWFRLEEGLAIKRALGDKRSIAYSLGHLAALALEDNRDKARSLREESLRISQELGDKRGIAWALNGLGSLPVWMETSQRRERALRRHWRSSRS